MSEIPLNTRLKQALATVPTFERQGRVVWAFAGIVRATGLAVRIGQSCRLIEPNEDQSFQAEVVGFSDGAAVLTSHRSLRGLSLNAVVAAGPRFAEVGVGLGLLGRVIGADGEPIDGRGPIEGSLNPHLVYGEPPSPLTRQPITTVFETGVKAIDGLLTIGFGQRVGIFSAAGCGKSTLLGMIARHSRSDINVIALIGERGREVGEFITQTLGPEGLARSVVVVSTSDRSSAERIRAANVATAIAEGFARNGSNVALMMDSVTRYARALRELGLAMGEPAVRRGFTPSVFVELPRLFERAGQLDRGSITAFYSVLLEDDPEHDPIGDEVRSILDGHIYLSRNIAERGRYPPINVGASISRLSASLTGAEHRSFATRLRTWLAKLEETELLRQIGEYKPGGDIEADEALAHLDSIEAFLRQTPEHAQSLGATVEMLGALERAP
jgi:type III secretion protein N (ATPase)